jgi:hypothetical protein
VPLAQDGFANSFIFGEAVGFELGENLLSVNENLEPAIAERLQLQQRDLLFEIFQDFLRQTDGGGFILSGRAVFDFDFHRPCVPAIYSAEDSYCQRGGSVG